MIRWFWAVAALAVLVPTPATQAATHPDVTQRITDWARSDLTGLQWGPDAIGAPQARGTATGGGVTVAVIDTGVDGSHPDLADNVDAGYSWVPTTEGDKLVYRLRANSAPSMDYASHGTHVSGIIAANDDGHGITGIAPQARILPINVAAVLSSASTYAEFTPPLARSIRLSADSGARVINMSLGSLHTELGPGNRAQTPDERDEAKGHRRLCRAIDYATDHGALVVVGAGNEGASGNVSSLPADCDRALTVGAVDSEGRRAYFSSYNDHVDLTAPGTSILSTVPRSLDWERIPAYTRMDGTSMAAPHVAGAAALLFSAHPDWSAQDVAARLTETSSDAGLPGPDVEFGAGIVDAEAALFGREGTWRGDPHTFAPMLREAANDAHEWVFAFNPPQRQVERYDMVVLSRSGVAKEYRLPAPAVATPALPNSQWVLISAVYTDGQVRSSGWAPTSVAADQSHRARPQNVRARYDETGRRATVRWRDGTYAAIADTTVVFGCPDAMQYPDFAMRGCTQLRLLRDKQTRRHRVLLKVPGPARAFDQRIYVLQAPHLTRERLLDAWLYGVAGTTVLRGRQPLVLSRIYRIGSDLVSVEGGINDRWPHAVRFGDPVTATLRTPRGRWTGTGYVTWSRTDGPLVFNRAFIVDLPMTDRTEDLRDGRVTVSIRSRGRTWTADFPLRTLM